MVEGDLGRQVVQVKSVERQSDHIDGGYCAVQPTEALADLLIGRALLQNGRRDLRQPRAGFGTVTGSPFQCHLVLDALQQTWYHYHSGDERANAVDSETNHLLRNVHL